MSRKPTKRELRMIAEARPWKDSGLAVWQTLEFRSLGKRSAATVAARNALNWLATPAGQAAVAGKPACGITRAHIHVCTAKEHDKLMGARRGLTTPKFHDLPAPGSNRRLSAAAKSGSKGADAMPARACLGKNDGSGGGRRPRTRRLASTEEPVSSPAAPTSSDKSPTRRLLASA